MHRIPIRRVVHRTARRLTSISLLFLLAACAPDDRQVERADYAEHDIASLQAMMDEGDLTSEALTRYYIDRIAAIDWAGPEYRSIIEINPQALEIAAALDAERRDNGPRGPLHGIPVVLKANIDTDDEMQTTAGSIALEGHRPPSDAFFVARLREAGAVILGKANLSEWANFRSTRSSSGWSSLGGQTKNAYDPLRNPCGSSSGSGTSVAISVTSVAVGTETNGSIVCPSSNNGIVGIKPTLGLVSRSGVIPIAHSQDTAGPMARTVEDAAILLTAMVGMDPNDPLAGEFPDSTPDYAAGLSPDALNGARIGVIRNYSGAGSDPRVDEIFEQSVATLRDAGAEIIDSIEIESEGMGEAQREVLFYEFKTDLAEYLQQSGAPLDTLADVIAFNEDNSATVMPIFGQERMLEAEARGALTDEVYLTALADSKRISQGAIDDTMTEHRLDALIAPTNGPARLIDHINGDQSSGISSSSLAAISGYASITVPAGDIQGLPIGVSFIGSAYDDAKLIRYGYAFEQHGYQRKAPPID